MGLGMQTSPQLSTGRWEHKTPKRTPTLLYAGFLILDLHGRAGFFIFDAFTRLKRARRTIFRPAGVFCVKTGAQPHFLQARDLPLSDIEPDLISFERESAEQLFFR